ncbi:YigZ family protein [Pontiellaceae bacterium B12227]|nr:YigZ family protein [Pontiellaceae bacterium B12227]
MSTTRYLVPAALHSVETVEKKSRFIATVYRIKTPDEAKAFVERIRTEHPNARHHCWAYVGGPAGSTHPCGMSDDGEPHGTAGRPMLQVLQNCGIGEIIVVVTRYFGGIKLGTGGLVRAYSGAVQAALETLPTEEAIEKERVRLGMAFEHEQALRHQFELLCLPLLNVEYGSGVTVLTEIPTDRFEVAWDQLKGALPHGALRLIKD